MSKHGWNEKLEALCLANEAILTPEIVGFEDDDVRTLKSEWQAGTDSGGTVAYPAGGGARLLPSDTGYISAVTNDGTDVTQLTHLFPYHAALVTWNASRAEENEIRTIVARLDPRADGGNPKTVSEFRCQLFRVARLDQSEASIIVPIGPEITVDATGEAPADFTFDFGAGVRVGPPPVGAVASSLPRVMVRIIALQDDGAVADNVTWLADSATSTHTGTGYSVTLVEATDIGMGPGEVLLSQDFTGVPEFTLNRAVYTAATITFTGATDFDDLTGSGDITVVARGETPSDTALTFEIDDGGGYATCYDGDVLGADNTPQGGADLSGVSTTGPWDMRVTLTPSTTAQLNTPTVRDMGLERGTSTLLLGAGMVYGGGVQIEPQSLKGNIAKAELVISKTGEDDYFDYGSNILATNHVGQTSVRLWLRDKDDAWLDRSEWMLVQEYRMEDYVSDEREHMVELVSPLAFLRGVIIPPFVVSSGADGTRTAQEVPTSAGDITDAYDDIMDAMYALPTRWRGPGPDSSTTVGPKLIRRVDKKDELDRLCFLDGSAMIASQGRVRTVKVMRDGAGAEAPVAHFPLGSYTAGPMGPGFGTRTDEYFVRWDWNEARQAFDAERHYLNATALDKLGGTGLYTTQQLDEETSKWVTSQTLADEIGARIPNHFGNGLIVWTIRSHYWRPQLELGDVVSIEATRFVARSPINDEPIRGRVAALAIVTRIGDLLGADLDLWIPGFDKIVVADGDVTLSGFMLERKITVAAAAFGGDGGELKASAIATTETYHAELPLKAGSIIKAVRSKGARINSADSCIARLSSPSSYTGSPPLPVAFNLETLTHAVDGSNWTEQESTGLSYEVAEGKPYTLNATVRGESDVEDGKLAWVEVTYLEPVG